MDSIPMVVISGQVPRDKIGEDAFQETDMVGISRPIVKHSFMVQRAEQIPGLIRKAFHIATTGRPGPVVVDIPKDVTSPAEKFDYAYPERVRMRSYNPVTRGHSGQIRKAVQLLLSASRPIIYSGGGVILGNATSQLRNLARMLDYPVTNTLMGLGAFPGTDRQFVGMLGMHGTYEANMAMHHADLVIAIGARFDDRVTNTPSKFCPEAKIIHIDIDPTSISKTVRADIPITGPVDAVLNDMISQIEEMRRNGAGQPDKAAIHAWWSRIDAWREAHGI
jgi:acetolactate synthase-1/2/3 large subunit